MSKDGLADRVEQLAKRFRIRWFQKLAERLRLMSKRTQAAEKLGLSRQMLYRYEYKEVDPADLQFKTIAKLAALLEQSLDAIAEDLGLVPRNTLTQIKSRGFGSEESPGMSVLRLSEYLQNILREKGLDWRNEGHLRIFAYGPGGPEDPDNVWMPEEFPRLLQLIEGTVDELKDSDYFRLTECVSALLGESISVKEFIAMATEAHPVRTMDQPDCQRCCQNPD